MEQKGIKDYERYLREAGLSPNTVIVYDARARNFLQICGKRMPDRDMVCQYVEQLRKAYKPRTVNRELTVKTGRIQPRRSLNNILSIQEYHIMLDYAKRTGRKKYYMLMRVLAGTGIRVGELKYITVEAVRAGNTDVYNKGKLREIFVPNELSEALLEYCREEQIHTGILFGGSKGGAISRNAVWQMLTKLAVRAGVDKRKVNPHSFRHLFAKTYMSKYGNLAELGDILGHSNLETTRIYTITTVEEKRERMNLLGI